MHYITHDIALEYPNKRQYNIMYSHNLFFKIFQKEGSDPNATLLVNKVETD